MQIGALEIQLFADVARLTRDMAGARRVVEEASSGMRRAAEMVKGALASIGAGLSLNALAQQVLGAQREFDKLNSSLITATGSVTNAGAAYKALQAFAATTPYSVAEATEAFIKMKNLGLDPSDRALRSYGNTAAAMGKDLNQMVEAVADASTGEFERLKEFGIKAKQNGDHVALTFRGVTTSIGNNAAEIQKYLRNIGEVEFGGAMELRAKTLDGAISGLGDAWGSFMLKLSQSGVGDAARVGVEKLTGALGSLGNSISLLTDGVITATKVGAAYVGAMVVAPVIFQATATAVGTFRLQLALARMEMASGATAATLLSTGIGGVAVSAQWASGALGKLAVVTNVLFAAFAGWQIGTYLNDQFVEAQIAGEVMAGALLEGWERIKFGGKVAFDALTLVGRASINTLLTLSSNLWESFAKGLRMMGSADAAAELEKFVGRVRAGVAAQGTFATRTAEARAEMEKSLKVIDQDTARRVTAALAADKLSEATRGEAKAAADAAKTKKELTDAEKKRIAAELKQQADLLAELSGLSPDFTEKWDALSKVYAKGSLSLTQLTEAQAALLAKQPFMIKQIQDEAKARKELEDFEKGYAQSRAMVSEIMAKSIEDAEKEAQEQETLAANFGMTAAQIEAVEVARLEEQLAQRNSLGLTLDEIETLEKLVAAKKRSVVALGQVESKDAANKAASDFARASEQIEQSLTDALLRGFESGKGFGQNLVDTIKNMFKTLVLRPIVSAIVNPVAGAITSGMGLTGAAQAAGTVASGSSALGSAGGLLGGIGAASSAFGSGIASGLSAWGAEGSVMGLLNSGALFGGGIVNGLGAIVGALGPIALGIGAAVLIWKKLDTSGTYHAGGAASATSAGVTAVSAGSLNMERIQANADTQKMVSQLAQGVVGILDSTALAFGKTAGYQAATAFADDTSKDGAWGSLVISKLGESIVNWQDTRGNGKWSQKTFADGEKGQEQYLAALTASVRTALDSIGLPDWARTMLNGVASDATLEDLAKVVDQINKTQAALGAMRSQLTGFASMSDSAVSALMAASGGIESLFSKASAYYDAFYTEAEKNSTVNEQIAKQLASVNLQMPRTKEGFRALVEAQMRLGTQGAESVSVLLANAAAFAQLHPEAEAATKSLESQRSALTEAYNTEADALQATIARMGSFATTLRGVRDSALLGNLSPLSPQEKYSEAKAQYQAVLAAARAGDEGAQSNYQGAFTSFLEASRAVFASSGQYQVDFAMAQAATEEAARWAELEADVGRAQLDVLKSQVSGIIEVNKSVLSVRDALLQYQAAMGGNTAPLTGYAPPPAGPIPYSSYGTSNTEALVAEVKALRTEVSGLRADQRQQTGDIIEAQFGAADESSDKITGGFKSVTTPAYRVSPE